MATHVWPFVPKWLTHDWQLIGRTHLHDDGTSFLFYRQRRQNETIQFFSKNKKSAQLCNLLRFLIDSSHRRFT